MKKSLKLCELILRQLGITLLILPIFSALPYSPLRPYDGSPIIVTSWVNKERKHYLQDSHLEIFPFKTFDRDYFYSHMLPNTPISFRYFPEKKIDPSVLKDAMNTLFYEVRQGRKRHFSEFEVLKDEAFNSRKQAGLLVVRGKSWPLNQFVVKLFMETPRSFIRASNKGLIAICHFIVGHGCTRYMLGFTRLKNLEMIKRMINDSPTWKDKVDFPRKWFWLPNDYPWIHLVAYHISGHERFSIDFPGAYAIIEDAINVDREFSLLKKQDEKTVVGIFNYLSSLMDPHFNNFVIERDTEKIVIIDTEHCPTMVALKEPVHIESYAEWYSYLVKKGLHECFGRTKGERKALHASHIPPYQGPESYRSHASTPTKDAGWNWVEQEGRREVDELEKRIKASDKQVSKLISEIEERLGDIETEV